MKKEDAQFMVDWDLFVAAVNEAAKMTALPKRYRDAIITTLGAEPEKPVL